MITVARGFNPARGKEDRSCCFKLGRGKTLLGQEGKVISTGGKSETTGRCRRKRKSLPDEEATRKIEKNSKKGDEGGKRVGEGLGQCRADNVWREDRSSSRNSRYGGREGKGTHNNKNIILRGSGGREAVLSFCNQIGGVGRIRLRPKEEVVQAKNCKRNGRV